MMNKLILYVWVVLFSCSCMAAKPTRVVTDFNQNWKFSLDDTKVAGQQVSLDDSQWRVLRLPHDWSIESDFQEKAPATPGGGALPGGVGWYRKTFTVEKNMTGKKVFVEFDGVYHRSEVWINGISLGKRPNGYISFRYDLTPHIRFGAENVIAVKVDNSQQPNSRWYSGSGIYRNVRLVFTDPMHVDYHGTYVTTPRISADSADINVQTIVKNDMTLRREVKVEQSLFDAEGKLLTKTDATMIMLPGKTGKMVQKLVAHKPVLWDIDRPYLYKVVTKLYVGGLLKDEYSTFTGIRSFRFDVEKGFFLNGKPLKINGVCNHHDLGALGAAVNTRAIERQLEILKAMGVNAIRTAHNPPAPELLDLCDRMGFIVQNEAFDIWRKGKTTYDYSLDFADWYERDLTDFVVRDRNHPSVIMWSIGNEVQEQWIQQNRDTINLQQANVLLNQKRDINPDDYKDGKVSFNALLTSRLVEIVKSLDLTRPVTAGCNETRDINPLFQSESLDLIGFNYHENEFADITKRFPKTPFIVTESVSSLQTRGFYLTPSDSMNIWPERWDKPFHNPLQKCSAYDNSHAPWGSTHETTWKIVKKYPHIAGQFIWTGFDYLGEPTPYWWPSRSSYFGIVDLAGFPKDVYYMYQSEWTSKDVLHVFPHWNWKPGQIVDLWAYYNNADEVEVFINGNSQCVRSKQNDDLHVMWRVKFEPGVVRAVSRKGGREVLVREIRTAGEPITIRLKADRATIAANGNDLSFVTCELLDAQGNAHPLADKLVKFTVTGEGFVAGTDNGYQNDHNSLKKPERHLFNGKCMAIVQSSGKPGKIILKASVEGLPDQQIEITAQ